MCSLDISMFSHISDHNATNSYSLYQSWLVRPTLGKGTERFQPRPHTDTDIGPVHCLACANLFDESPFASRVGVELLVQLDEAEGAPEGQGETGVGMSPQRLKDMETYQIIHMSNKPLIWRHQMS